MNTVVAQRPAQKPIDLIRSQLYLPSMQEQLKTALPPQVTVAKPGSDDLAAVQRLWRAHSDSLGFFPDGAFRQHAE